MASKFLRTLNVMIVLAGFGLIVQRYFAYPSPAQVAAAKIHLQNLATAMQLFYEKHSAYPPSGRSLSELHQALSPFLENAEVDQSLLFSLKLVRYRVLPQGYQLEVRVKRKRFFLDENGLRE